MKSYLGDGAYIDWDGFSLILTTENGVSVTNRIVPVVARMTEAELDKETAVDMNTSIMRNAAKRTVALRAAFQSKGWLSGTEVRELNTLKQRILEEAIKVYGGELEQAA